MLEPFNAQSHDFRLAHLGPILAGGLSVCFFISAACTSALFGRTAVITPVKAGVVCSTIMLVASLVVNIFLQLLPKLITLIEAQNSHPKRFRVTCAFILIVSVGTVAMLYLPFQILSPLAIGLTLQNTGEIILPGLIIIPAFINLLGPINSLKDNILGPWQAREELAAQPRWD